MQTANILKEVISCHTEINSPQSLKDRNAMHTQNFLVEHMEVQSQTSGGIRGSEMTDLICFC